MPKITNTRETAFTIKGVNRDLANSFRAACHINGKLYRDVLLELMQRYVRENHLPLKGNGGGGTGAKRS